MNAGCDLLTVKINEIHKMNKRCWQWTYLTRKSSQFLLILSTGTSEPPRSRERTSLGDRTHLPGSGDRCTGVLPHSFCKQWTMRLLVHMLSKWCHFTLSLAMCVRLPISLQLWQHLVLLVLLILASHGLEWYLLLFIWTPQCQMRSTISSHAYFCLPQVHFGKKFVRFFCPHQKLGHFSHNSV